MKDVLKSALGTVIAIVGLNILGGIALLIIVGVVSAAASSKKDQSNVGLPVSNENKVLKLTFYNVPDRSPEGFMDVSFDLDAFGSTKIGLHDYLNAIQAAKEDEKYKGIYIDLNYVWSNWANLEELRKSLVDFKESGKFIISYGDAINKKAYWLATVSDKVFLTPTGILDWNGINATITYYKKALEKLGIEVQVFKYGKYKSAVEPFLLDKMSEASREQTSALIHSIFDKVVEDVSQARNIPVVDLFKMADDILIQNPQDAVEYGLIDAAKYKDEVLKEIRWAVFEKDTTVSPKYVPISKYVKSLATKNIDFGGKERVAVVYASGDIIMGKGKEGSIGGQTYASAIQQAREDSSVKAIVLRISSGGGSALASDIIWRELELTKGVKPVVVSMGSAAASGGYYIACNADRIVADANTITGSIGVFGMMPYTGKMMEEKIGLTYDGVSTTKYADLGSTVRPVSDFERDVIQNGVNQIYEDFVNKVAAGRGMTFDQVHEIAQGRVWSGTQALELGLVDTLGGLQEAITIAANKAGVEDYKLVGYPKREEKPWKAFLAAMNQEVKAGWVDQDLKKLLETYKRVKSWSGRTGVQARMPYEIEIN